MNKTCKGCYAADKEGHPLGEAIPYGCILGYETDGKGHPKEDCPKPKSWKQLRSVPERR